MTTNPLTQAQTTTAATVAPPLPPSDHPIPPAPVVKSEVSSSEPLLSVVSHAPEPSSISAPLSISIPSCSAWFSWDEIHETEKKVLPEFFDGKSTSRNPRVYKYYRDSIIGRFRSNPSRKITFTEVRRGLVGDVGSVRRVFDFLEAWGLINYTPSSKQAVKEKKGEEEALDRKESPKRLCTNCKSVCSLVCFATDKCADVILCARCFVRGNYRPGLSATDFKRVDISEDTRTEWTDKETLHLLEAVLQYGEDWKKVAEHVGARTEKDCIARFIKLPFGEQFLGPSACSEDGDNLHRGDHAGVVHGDDVEEPGNTKRRCLTPLADASNPIMAQVAFLSAMVGPEVVEAAAQAAIEALHTVDLACSKTAASKQIGSTESQVKEGEAVEEAATEARLQLEKEQQDVEKSIADIVEIEMKKIQEKIEHFEQVELQIEKERLQLQHMKDLLFADQLNLLRHKPQSLIQKSSH